MTMTDSTSVYREIEALIDAIRREANVQAAAWRDRIERKGFCESALNLAQYMAFRHRDHRALQRSLMTLGLSSLGRLESRVMPTLVAVKAALAALAGLPREDGATDAAFFAGERLLAQRAHEVLGNSTAPQRIALLVTCPTEAADDPDFMRGLAERGVEALRINCAHDNAERWSRMIGHARAAEAARNHRFRIMMDLGGPKVRTGLAHLPEAGERIGKGDLLAMVPPGGLERVALADRHFSVECTLVEALGAAKVGDRIYIDDGKLAAKSNGSSRGNQWRVCRAPRKGVKLKPAKGLNFPDTELPIAALTERDRTDLDFVAAHADGIGFSFVQSADDVSHAAGRARCSAVRTTGAPCAWSRRSRRPGRCATCPTSSCRRRDGSRPR